MSNIGLPFLPTPITPITQISPPMTDRRQDQLRDRPGDGRAEIAPHLDLMIVMGGQLPEDFGQVAALLADVDQLAGQGRKELARGRHGFGQAAAVVDVFAHLPHQAAVAQRAFRPRGSKSAARRRRRPIASTAADTAEPNRSA